MKDAKERQVEQSYAMQEITKARELWLQGQGKEALLIILELEKTENYSYRESLLIKLLKANIFSVRGEYLDAINCCDDLFQKFQREGDLLSSYDALTIQAHSFAMLGKISKGESIVKQAESLLSEIKKAQSIDLRERESFLLRLKGIFHSFRGDVRRSLIFNRKAYELVKDTENYIMIGSSLNNLGFNYFYLKEYDKAIKYSKEALKIPNDPGLAFPLGNLIEIYLRKGEIKEAKVYYDQLRDLKKKNDTKINNEIYEMYTAEFLKTSLRSRNRIEAEDIFKKIAFDTTASHEGRIAALINICDLLLVELRLTNDVEVLDEIQPYIQKLLEIAESQNFSLILAETYLLQAKLSLLTFDTKKAKRFLTQAKQIAKRFGHEEMVGRITKEQSSFFRKSNSWEELKETGATMAERIKLAKLKEQIEELDEKRVFLTAFITEEKVSIHKELKICLVCRSEVLRFSYICECGTIYCDSCARAVSDLENVCWSCESPIDNSKPVKQIEEEHVGVKFEKKKKLR